MLIEEIIRSCANESVAEAAVASIGRCFHERVKGAAAGYDMSVGAFAKLSVDRFARHGDEGELRSVLAAMHAAQEPVLAGLHRILCIMLMATVPDSAGQRRSERLPRMAAMLCAMEPASRRQLYG